ncbi:PIN domain nuclease [Bacillus pseudomycoides]|uniref:PIN domain nuclease n=1 Tax=Bacillus pseudomycoides TaxID=64104 RepID=A0AA91ZRX8_9BACI|nr:MULTISPECIES: PIN/TRAM domain-containing protein [Bacillus]PEB50768.1 PIN domain nuclease [Bacillus sp. AFS098217]PED80874.1 PIN domain nuclease [Bacillus pseudomycoides]PEU09899.1 PIN domain nuclease [Bacillus sp. AFS019443]PEU17557.1 PIN domain nuclease [Bacillus sp. AFS014408]PFW61900.1 PIN domain nuclease [Bacillus sp. AFS075034]
MLKRIVQLFFLVIGGALGIFLIPKIIDVLDIGAVPFLEGSYVRAIIGAIILFLTTFWLVDYIVQLIKHIEEALVKAPVADVLFGTLGLISGLIVAYLILIPIREFTIPVISTVLQIFFTLLLGYLGFQVGFKKRNELLGLFTLPQRGGKKKNNNSESEEIETEESSSHWKILDTSVIIDGRIADICQTKFLEGTIVIPQFVLEELQHIADSSDALKRNRGRRGLDILNRIQKEIPIPVEIYEGDFEDIQEVDSKLVKLAKVTGGTVVTNDFNLNKVSELQGVTVLNINDLANAIKPVVLPGEELSVYVVKDGKEQNQGVAYLDDGTMIVVEDGREYVGSQLDVLVTSVLQTSAGRMIFAKRKLLEKAL